MTQQRRHPSYVYGVGEDPDPRFSFANERTALAWLRTATALVSGGIVLISASSIAELTWPFVALGMAACVGGGALAVYAVLNWVRAERALRTRASLPTPSGLVPLSFGIIMLAGLCVVAGVTAALV